MPSSVSKLLSLTIIFPGSSASWCVCQCSFIFLAESYISLYVCLCIFLFVYSSTSKDKQKISTFWLLWVYLDLCESLFSVNLGVYLRVALLNDYVNSMLKTDAFIFKFLSVWNAGS